jgi:hypothetical protein
MNLHSFVDIRPNTYRVWMQSFQEVEQSEGDVGRITVWVPNVQDNFLMLPK